MAENTNAGNADKKANIGVVGLAVMGSNLARNLAHHGNTVAVFNRTYARTETLMKEHGKGEIKEFRLPSSL